jgi:hypothetical protein
MAQSTRPLLLLFLRFEQGAWVRAQPYDLSRTLHAIRYRHSRLFLLYPSFVDYYIPFLCITVTLGWKLCRAGWKKRWGNDRSWSKGWLMYLLTCRVLALQRVYLRQLLCSRNLHHLICTLLLWVGISCIYVWSSFILSHMQSLLLCVETIGGIKWSACYAISKSGNSKSAISKSSYVTLERLVGDGKETSCCKTCIALCRLGIWEPLSLLTLVW